jgi:hypothetical protein
MSGLFVSYGSTFSMIIGAFCELFNFPASMLQPIRLKPQNIANSRRIRRMQMVNGIMAVALKVASALPSVGSKQRSITNCQRTKAIQPVNAITAVALNVASRLMSIQLKLPSFT